MGRGSASRRRLVADFALVCQHTRSEIDQVRVVRIEQACLALPAFDQARPENQPDANA